MIYLASSSPRRAELMRQIGVEFNIIEVDIDETPRVDESIEKLVLRLCQEKVIQGRLQVPGRSVQNLVLAADTLIGLQGKILGKPASNLKCCEMLQLLSGKTHQVYSAVALMNQEGEVNARLSVNDITFRPLKSEEIKQYCDTAEPHDKAGAYAIQGMAAIFIKHLSGSYSSVMGMPLYETAELLQQAGYRFQVK